MPRTPRLLIPLTLYMLALASPASARTAGDPLADLPGYVERSMRQWRVPGLAIAVVKGDRVVLARGFGVRDVRGKEPVNDKTVFAIASNTKAFTATALGLLVQRKKITWDAPVVRYLPGFQLYDAVATRKITVRDLLCHRSGLGTWAGDLASYGSVYSREEVIRRIRFQRPAFPLRTSFGYSNLMFLVAGEIIPAVTGTSWDRFIERSFFTPLGMRRSNTSVTRLAAMPNVATPHRLEGSRAVPIPYVNVDNHAPAGAINSCAVDLAQWLLLQIGDGTYRGRRLVDRAVIAETRRSHTLIPLDARDREVSPHTHFINYGLGWGLRDYRGRLLVQHTGGLDGMFSYVGLLPEENLGVVVLTNLEHHKLNRALPYRVYDAFLGAKPVDWSARLHAAFLKQERENARTERAGRTARIAGTRPTHPLAAYAGVYDSAVYGEARVVLRGGRLAVHPGAHPRVEGVLQHWQRDSFRCRWNNRSWGESLLHFDLDDRGRIVRFRIKVRPDWVDTYEYRFVRKKR